jgi:hypothetical protein
VHVPEQLHAAPSGKHASTHFFVAGSHFLLQQSRSAVQSAVLPRHPVGGRLHRGGSKVTLSHKSFCGVARQHPRCGPEVHVSPVGRQVEFAGSTSHSPRVVLHTPEQHSAFAAQRSPGSAQSLGAQTPLKHPSEQQSCARVHGTPFPLQASPQSVRPAWPTSGSHRPLQHDSCELHALPGNRHTPGPVVGLSAHAPLSHDPEQHSVLPQHFAPFDWQLAAAHVPPAH